MSDITQLERRKILQEELAYRRDRRNAIATWANTILVAIIGGIVGLELQGEVSLSDWQRVVITAAVVILTGFSTYWWLSHRGIEMMILDQRAEIDAALNIDLQAHVNPGWRHIRGVETIVLLGAAAVLAIWLMKAAPAG